MNIYRSHLDIDGFMLVKPKSTDLKRRMTKTGLNRLPGAERTIDTLMASKDFVLASVLTARPKARNQQTVDTLTGYYPQLTDLTDQLQFVGGTRWPYRLKVDAVSRDQNRGALFNSFRGVLFDDSVYKSVNAIGERLRRTPADSVSPAGIALVGFGVDLDELRIIAKSAVSQVGPDITVVDTEVEDTIGITNKRGEMAFATAMPTHAPDDLARAMQAVRDIHELTA